MKRVQIILSSLLLSVVLLACDNSNAHQITEETPEKAKKKERKADYLEAASNAVQIEHKWEVPDILREVSGIAFLGNGRFACVQDEAGIIFIYNTQDQQIERQITFGAAGDYEGITLVDSTAYIVRSDGTLFGVSNINSSRNKITEYATPLTARHDVEGLAYDPHHQRLLLAIKGEENGNVEYKGVYAFDLKSKKLSSNPVFKLNLRDSKLFQKTHKAPTQVWQPSEIAVHPVTGDIYLTEAANPQLFILNPDGSIRVRHKLSKTAFHKPEGITFSPTGDLYISNEGKIDPGNILQVELQESR